MHRIVDCLSTIAYLAYFQEHRLRTRYIVDRRAVCSIEKRDNVGIYRTGKKQGEASHLLALDGRAWLLAFQNHADHRRLHRIMQSYTQ